MDITPGRAPFTIDEEYVQLRQPKTANMMPNVVGHPQGMAAAAAAAGMYQNATGQNLMVGGGQYGGGGVAAPPMRTVSPSNLSPYAKEFVPRPTAQQDQTFQQYQPQQQQQQQQQQRQQQSRYMNGYHQTQQQQQQQQSYNAQVTSLVGSVQERLKIGSGGGGGGGGGSNSNSNQSAGGSYYQPRNQQQQQQQQQQPPYHQPYSQRNNKSFHQQQQQHQQMHQQRFQQQQQQKQQQQQQQQQATSNGGDNGAGGSNSVETIALEYLQSVIQCLNQNPGQFDSIATRFLTIFDGMENNQFVLANAMENIFIESIQNPNFRYMGAKLYNLLHMLNLKKDSLFHELLKCKLEYHQKEVIEYMQSNQQQKVRETALFLAELYMQLRGDDSRIHLIAENILYSLEKLLSKESSDNIRCVCLTLKLAGYDLTADCPQEMNRIIQQLDEVNVQAPGKYPLAANVISLQKNNWGRKIQSSKSDPELAKPPEPLRTSDEPIFYGPDGNELTAEEAEFLCGNMGGNGGGGGGASGGSGSTDDDDVDLDVDLDPEMDEETEKAYKEFCKLNATS